MFISDFHRWPNQPTLPFLTYNTNFLAGSRQAQNNLVNKSIFESWGDEAVEGSRLIGSVRIHEDQIAVGVGGRRADSCPIGCAQVRVDLHVIGQGRETRAAQLHHSVAK